MNVRRRLMLGGVCVALAACVGGCASSRAADTRPVAECPVCKCNGDLACLTVHVDGATPRAEVGGKTYFFCSPDCKCAFEKSPQKYAGK